MTAPAPARARTGGLQVLFRPRGIAVVGASADPGKLGAALLRSLESFPGFVAPVNPRTPGMHVDLAAAAAAGPVDLAILCLPAAACPEVLAEAAASGVGAAVVCGGGFAEAGPAGVALQHRLAEIAAESGIRVLGPNTSGFLAPPIGLRASFVPGTTEVPPGRVAVVAASGGVNHALAFSLAETGHGVSLAVGIGNGVDVGAADVLEHLCDDADTTAVALHVETVADGPRLVRALRRLTAMKPVVALVVGRHDVGEFAASHTGALATSWRTTRAALAQAGAVLVDDERELLDAVGALSVRRLAPAPAPGVGVLIAQAGPGLLLLDSLKGRQIPVPELTKSTVDRLGELLPPLTFQRNPVDTGRPGPDFGAVLGIVAADPGVDLVAGYALDEPGALDLAAAVGNASATVPVVFGIGGAGSDVRATRSRLRRAGVAVVDTPAALAAATAALVRDARARHRMTRPTLDRAPRTVSVPTGPLDEHRAKQLLEALGVAVPARRACGDRAAAHAALGDLGGPVAVKILDANVLHKTEIGGVHLDVRTPDDLDRAWDALAAVGARAVLVERMAGSGVDLIVGARRDPVFGPIVLLGLGGVAAEVTADVAVRLASLTPQDAAEMPDELAGVALLAGWRGGPTLDRDALATILVGLGHLLASNPHLLEIEVNPLRLGPDGLTALDAVVRTDEETDGHPDR